MSDREVRALLTSLRRAAGQVRLYGKDHPLAVAAKEDTARSAHRLVSAAGTSILTFLEDSIYLNREVLAAISLEFNGLIRTLQHRGIESITISPEMASGDVARLAEIVADAADIEETGNGLAVNETPWNSADLGDGATAALRRAYADSLDLLRGVGGAVADRQDMDLGKASSVVRGLLEQTINQPGAALLLANVKNHHEYTFYHSVNTCILSLGLGRLAGLPDQDLMTLGLGALLHDIGKLGVSADVLQHPGRLSPDQWKEIRRHPRIGATAIMAAAGADQEVAAAIAFEHHARFDGSGYPRLVYHDHTQGDDHHAARRPQHFFSRLVAVADTYDAITTRRSYRRAEPPGRALGILLRSAGTGHDPDAVLAFVHLLGVYPPGSLLRLYDGSVVMAVAPALSPDEVPAAVLVRTPSGEMLEPPEPVQYTQFDIAEMLTASAAEIDTGVLLQQAGVAVEAV